MGAVTSFLGPDQICCLTAVASDPQSRIHSRGPLEPRVYRRPAAFAKRRHIQMAGLGAATAEILLRERPQVVQVSTAHDGYIALWLHRWFKLPFVIYAHGNEILDAQKSTWPKPRLSLMQAARVLAISHFTGRLVQKAGVDPGRIEVVHPGCDVDRFQPCEPGIELRQKLLSTQWRDRVILSVGRLVARKGHDMVIRALPRLLQETPNLVYLIAGDGPYRTELDKLASSMGVRNHVSFAGQIADELLPRVYALSDVFVMASREQPDLCEVEGFGLVFLEANACAKPVVAGRSGGIPDAVADGVSGFLVDPLDPEDIARALSRILESPELAVRLGRQGRARVLQEFTWTHFADRLRQILTAVVEGNSGEIA